MATEKQRDERRSGKDRRSGVDTRTPEQKKLIGERRKAKDRRSGLDRRSEKRFPRALRSGQVVNPIARFTPASICDLRKVLKGLPNAMKVGIGPGVLLNAKTVAELRAIAVWPLGLALEFPRLIDRESVVNIERVAV